LLFRLRLSLSGFLVFILFYIHLALEGPTIAVRRALTVFPPVHSALLGLLAVEIIFAIIMDFANLNIIAHAHIGYMGDT